MIDQTTYIKRINRIKSYFVNARVERDARWDFGIILCHGDLEQKMFHTQSDE